MAPAVEYEALMDLVIMGILALLWRRHPKSGVIFSLAFLLYSVMRFFVSFLRTDSKTIVWGLTTPQVVSLLIIPISLALLIFFLRRKEPEFTPFVYGQAGPRRQTASRAERRRRARATQPAGRTETPR
jgi:prolipoprotein diacylglyceryltransferase